MGRGEAWGEGDGARGKGGGKGRGRHQQAIHAATGWRRTELTRAGGTGDGDVCTVPEDLRHIAGRAPAPEAAVAHIALARDEVAALGVACAAVLALRDVRGVAAVGREVLL